MKTDRSLRAFGALVGGIVFGSSAFAFQPLVTDDTGTQGSGGNQIELAGTRVRDADTTRDLAFVFTRGVAESVDLFVELGRQRIEAGGTAETGPTNPAIGAKWRVYENERKTSLALKPVYFFPHSGENEARGLGTGKSSYEASLILTQEMGWGAVHANLVTGREKYRDAGQNTTTSGFSVAPVWNVHEQWKLAADLGISRSSNNGVSEKSRFGELGAIYSPNGDLDFALGFIRETNRDTNQVTRTATTGLTWRFK